MEKCTLRELVELRACTDSRKFQKISLNYERDSFLRQALSDIKEHLLLDTFDVSKVVDEYVEAHLDPKNYSSIKAYEYDKDVKRDVLIRFFNYLSDFEVVAVNKFFNVTVGEFEVKGVADLILRTGVGYEAVMFTTRTVPYSRRARKAENKPENSIELLACYCGLSEEYPHLSVSIYSTKSKNDKGGMLAPYLPEQCSVSLCPSKDDAYESLLNACSLAVCKDCDSCEHKDVCQLKELRFEEKADDSGGGSKVTYTDKQLKVVNHVDGELVAIAVPGAGKTRSVVGRILHMVESGVPADKILVLTFSNKACGELVERLTPVLGDRMPMVSTFNGLGYKILRDNPLLLGMDAKLAGPIDKKLVIEQVLDECPRIAGMSYNGLALPFGLISTLMKAFDSIDENREAWLSNNASKDVEGILRVYEAYKRRMDVLGFISYDEQITLVNKLLTDNPGLLRLYKKTWTHLIVDEFQDTDEAQYTMTKLLSSGNLCVVGDDDQAIYGFRGGSSEYILNFKKDFPNAEVVIMDNNFRSNDKIAAACNAVITANAERYDKFLVAHKEAKNKPVYFKDFTLNDVQGIIDKAIANGYKPGEIAIIARNNKILNNIAETLTVKCLSPKDYLIEDGLFLFLYDFLRVAVDVHCDPSLYRVLRRISDAPIEEYYKEDCKASLHDNLIKKDCFVSVFHRLRDSFRLLALSDSLLEAVRSIFLHFFDITSHPVLDRLETLIDERGIQDAGALCSYMGNMIRFADDTRCGYNVNEEYVNLLTAHDSKGKEFSFVLLYGFELFEDTPEEIRLAFVAMSRAKDTLFITESAYSEAPLYPAIKEAVTLVGSGRAIA